MKREYAFKLAAFFVEVDHVNRLMAVNPVLHVIAFRQDAEVVPFVGLEFLELELADDPRLARGVDDDLLAGVSEDAAAAFFVEHAVVIGAAGDDVALIARDDGFAEIGALGGAIVNAAVSLGSDFDLGAQFEVLGLPPRQTMKRL